MKNNVIYKKPKREVTITEKQITLLLNIRKLLNWGKCILLPKIHKYLYDVLRTQAIYVIEL